MTDKSTELLREGLTEHGIEWRSGLKGVTFVGDWCFVEYDNGKLAATCEPVLTPKQAIAATLGGVSVGKFVGLKKGKIHESHIRSEYYCGGCGWPVTDHDSYCGECGGALHEGATLGAQTAGVFEKIEELRRTSLAFPPNIRRKVNMALNGIEQAIADELNELGSETCNLVMEGSRPTRKEKN